MVDVTEKLKGFTLIETIVALVIIMISFGIALLIFINVQNSNKNMVQLEMIMAIENLATIEKNEKTFLDQVYEFETFTIEKTFFPYQNNDEIVVMHLSSYNKQHKKLAEIRELVLSRKQ